MYDAKKIVVGLVIFVAVITYPIWHAISSGRAGAAPQLERPAKAEKCIEPTEYMRAEHMKLLEDWRQSAVREGVRRYTATDGQVYNISLSGTCLDCHADKAKFCDSCHNYAGVQPTCWSCHNAPERGQP